MIKKICLVLVGFSVTLGVMFVSSKTKTLNEKDIVANNRMALYIEKDGTYEKTNAIPKGDYVLNSSKSKCSNGAIPKWNSNTNSLKLSNLTKDNTSCYLYFDLNPSYKTLIKLNLTSKGSATFTGTSCNEGCTLKENGVYETEDDFGTSYYFRGSVDNNWIVFGIDTTTEEYIWWRIIRINGNGTIRLIYAGTSNSINNAPSTTGDTTMIKLVNPVSEKIYQVEFNKQYNDNKYVGYMYGGSEGQTSLNYETAHIPETSSTVLDEIEYWYSNKTNLKDIERKNIDVDTGFCGDRGVDSTSVSEYSGLGFGQQQTGYAPWTRLYNGSSWKGTQTPTLKCGADEMSRKRDLYTGPNAKEGGTKGNDGKVEGNNKLPVPVGMVNSDEVVYAGGFGGRANYGYWLCTNRYYWTISPFRYSYNSSSDQYANVFRITDDGFLDFASVNHTSFGVRPVINIKADVEITGTGIDTDPYVIE